MSISCSLFFGLFLIAVRDFEAVVEGEIFYNSFQSHAGPIEVTYTFVITSTGLYMSSERRFRAPISS